MLHPLGMLCVLAAILGMPALAGLAGHFIDEVLKLNGTKKGIASAITVVLIMAIFVGLLVIAWNLGYV